MTNARIATTDPVLLVKPWHQLTQQLGLVNENSSAGILVVDVDGVGDHPFIGPNSKVPHTGHLTSGSGAQVHIHHLMNPE